ncbi:hypothetical protein PN478_18045 [Dolichospermum circinale CS-534/05]|nr:hypothetical protein [Dolichospermum circinale]MDB9453983.1 hypothetical protein [Dolichospermum circinale CS-541/06]MDB9463158.1 hypothetical protein [Dolichospermum circinale CS-541/04]MDB9492410.1 hypothetical protein [Dolichospermum circinale CS-534/05]MDB9548963.1 hypothetical protein [Dolichospermum circinale CS-1031]
MQAYKLKGKIDESGNLLITETVNLPPHKCGNYSLASYGYPESYHIPKQ